MSQPLQLLRGPMSLMAQKVGTLLEGEPCQAAVILPDGTAFELLWIGGKDGSNKLMGGGDQTSNGEPTWMVPDPFNPGSFIAGIRVYDTLNRYIWCSNADGTWTAFCPCFGGLPPESGGSGSGTHGGGGLIVTPCCPDGVSSSLVLSYSFGGNNYQLALGWSGDAQAWQGSNIPPFGAQQTWQVSALLACASNEFQLSMAGQTIVARSVNCSPFELIFPNLPATQGLFSAIGVTA